MFDSPLVAATQEKEYLVFTHMPYLFFDFDGVIVDSLDISYESSRSASGGSFSLEEYLSRFHGNIYEFFKGSEADVPKQSIPNVHNEFFRLYIPRLLERPPVDGMRRVLEELSGTHTMAIVSSTINAPIQHYLDRYEIARHFDTVFGADTHTSKVKKIEMLLDLYAAAPEECLFITDTLGDMREAEKAGIKSMGVSWGFHSIETLERGAPVAIAKSPEEFLRLVVDFFV